MITLFQNIFFQNFLLEEYVIHIGNEFHAYKDFVNDTWSLER